jgi:D-glycero-D-manno-heptose 1,7-bisphosphate phosphatase
MNKALFLDRDGIVNVDKCYVGHIADFEFMPGIFDALRIAQKQNYLLFIITNQSGIARGYYTEDDFLRLTTWMIGEFRKEDVEITKVYHCPFHVDGVIPQFTGESQMRKPNPGMLLLAQQEYDLVLSESIMIGDKESDIEAGERAGVGHTIRVVQEDGTRSRAGTVIKSIFDLAPLLGRSDDG